ncbi:MULTISPECIES: hypothetical protein [unclassified Endozoicomonas]|uniref:hypothetical protein n=1 Tax=unclassified Endozoicomonas TaxID=2644528 RepID=UPI003BB6A02C
MSDSRPWGSAYYSERSNPVHRETWGHLLQQKCPSLKEDVTRAVNHWNQQVRDHLRGETALKLTIGNDTIKVPVAVVDGLPLPFAEVLGEFENWPPLLPNREVLKKSIDGLLVTEQHFNPLQDLVPADIDREEVSAMHQWLVRILDKLDQSEIIRRLCGIQQDILSAYFFHVPKVEIYWMAIGVASVLFDIPVEALTIVVLAHELAHAYTHLGKDIDGKQWETPAFAQSDLRIVEGLAQFYTEAVCKKLERRYQAALAAYESLLKNQSEPYTVQIG